ncbi:MULTISPECIES: tetratricopeptide repeat protein [Bacillus]|mgnify:CR=1 FL=1|uniref:Aspartate phosphatase n=1 Tax=Bacillus glycinifermentans TaxID=1664069 RepID=A0A0T6BNE0_9BACI|nr:MULTISPECIES: tetratricopeptide repeat protein [Bacillus]ATH94979.1 tetratricopeptide repeat-containing protein [Bacillus glycinifermentans]KKB73439.1 aspartate phosphatase [Bacillus sp. TH008]KRT93169.1 aspartate phosphatase [Bacillus glycinifermentans]MDU0069653.1 tetratricopeptide repeat protein [Bacillus sp. IG6]MEC0487659.1 tetratricopeptide repeat protein [Bacillus glycinifermentans]
MNKIPAEEAANILNSWYRAIEENDTEQSVRLFKQAKPLIKEMEESEAFLTYYALLEEMHNGMPDDNRGEGYGDSHLISYYFHLFSGAYESYKKNDQQAIGFYKTAEKKLAHVDDPIEAARFHEKIGKLYYDLGENLMSLSHTRQAMEIFQDHGGYAMNLVSVYMTMADNYTEMGKYKEAEQFLAEAVKTARAAGDHVKEAHAFHHYGLLYSAMDKPEESITYLEKALKDKAYAASDHYFQSVYLLIKELFKTGGHDRAIVYYTEGKERSREACNDIFDAKVDVLYSVYHEKAFDDCKKSLAALLKRKQYDSVRELSLIAANVYSKKALYKEAAHFFLEAIQTEEMMKKAAVMQ